MKTICVVLDTNVLVSAHLNARGHERHVLGPCPVGQNPAHGFRDDLSRVRGGSAPAQVRDYAARADYLVTGNKRHFPRNRRQTLVVNARELIEWAAPELRR
jgi:hypothetical protein